MAVVALLSARALADSGGAGVAAPRRGELAFATQSLIEYQARQAHAAGADQILILVDDISPVLTGAVDRLSVDGVRATLIRDLPTLGRMIGDGDRIVLIGDGHVLPSAHITHVAQQDGPCLLVLPSAPLTQGFERIDGEHMWAGALAAPAPMLLGLLDMLGDWDLPLTFMRHVVQQGGARATADLGDILDGRIAIVTSPAVAEAATQVLAHSRDQIQPGGDMDDWPVGGPAARIVPFAIRHEIAPSLVRQAAIGIGLLGVVAVLGGLVTLGCLLCFASLIGDRVAGQLDRLLRFVGAARAIDHATSAIALLAIAGVGLRLGEGVLGATTALLCVGLIALGPLLDRRGQGSAGPRALRIAPGGVLLILALGGLSGATASLFALCTILAFASHAHRLLRA